MLKRTSHYMRTCSLQNKRLILIGPAPPPFGGMALQSQQLKRLLELEGYQVKFIAVNFPLSPKWIEKLKFFRAFYRLIGYIIQLSFVSKRYTIWHILANSGWSWFLYSVPAIFIGKIKGVKVIVNYRGGGADRFLSRYSSWVRHSLKFSDICIVPSSYLNNVFKQYNISSQIVPNIIDGTYFNADHLKFIEKLKDNQKIVLSITRNLENIYDIDSALYAFKRVLKSYPQAELRIAGSGPEKERLCALAAELSLSECVTFLGKLTRKEMIQLYHETDILVNSSLIDNMPNSLLEAMACGVPIVTTDVGGIPYLVVSHKTALMVSPNNPEMMADSICQLIENDTLRNSLIKNGIQASQAYIWPNIKEQWFSVYHEAS